MRELVDATPLVIPSTTPVKLLPIADNTYGKLFMLGIGDTKPDDSIVGVWGIGAIFMHMDGANGSALYVNEGTTASSDFNLITVA